MSWATFPQIRPEIFSYFGNSGIHKRIWICRLEKKFGCTARVVGFKGPSTNFMHEVQFTHRDESLLTLWQQLYNVFCGFGGNFPKFQWIDLVEVIEVVKARVWTLHIFNGKHVFRESVRVEWDTIKLHYGNRRLIFGAWPILGTKSQAISSSAAMILFDHDSLFYKLSFQRPHNLKEDQHWLQGANLLKKWKHWAVRNLLILQKWMCDSGFQDLELLNYYLPRHTIMQGCS